MELRLSLPEKYDDKEEAGALVKVRLYQGEYVFYPRFINLIRGLTLNSEELRELADKLDKLNKGDEEMSLFQKKNQQKNKTEQETKDILNELPLSEKSQSVEFSDLEENKKQVEVLNASNILEGIKSRMNILQEKMKENKSKDEDLLSGLKIVKQDILNFHEELKKLNDTINPLITSLENKLR